MRSVQFVRERTAEPILKEGFQIRLIQTVRKTDQTSGS